MKKFMFLATVTLLSAFLILGTAYAGVPGNGIAQSQQNGWYDRNGGDQNAYGMGNGMMGYGMGSGMMGSDYGMRNGMMGRGYGMGNGTTRPSYGYNQQYRQPQKPINEKDARRIVENYLNSTRNPNLKLGKIKDEGSAFEVDIVTKSNGNLVDRLLVSKDTGRLRPAY